MQAHTIWKTRCAGFTSRLYGSRNQDGVPLSCDFLSLHDLLWGSRLNLALHMDLSKLVISRVPVDCNATIRSLRNFLLEVLFQKVCSHVLITFCFSGVLF